jgi:aldose 1-epimerase
MPQKTMMDQSPTRKQPELDRPPPSGLAHCEIRQQPFGKMPDGAVVDMYTLAGDTVEVDIIGYGARIVSLRAPDREGRVADIALGHKSLDEYFSDKSYLGAVVGRYGNRIAHGRFTLDGQVYPLPLNNGENSLHGGRIGFDKHLWQPTLIPNGVELTLVSPAGDQGYPGTLTAQVRYTLSGAALRVDYIATTDQPTVVNLTNHSFFNLSGEGSGTILAHELTLPADQFTPVNAGLIPTGVLAPVDGTPFDFRSAAAIGARIGEPSRQLKMAGGYDQNWVLRGVNGVMKEAARLLDPATGRLLTVTTTEPGVQFYSGNFLDGSVSGKTGSPYVRNAGLALETQHYPDSPNHPNFPATVLRPGETMRSTTVFTFSTQPS